MTDNPQLIMTGLLILIVIFCFAIIWFVFMVPMEKGLYKRRMAMIRKKLEQNEERLRRERREAEERESEAAGKAGSTRRERRRRAGGEG